MEDGVEAERPETRRPGDQLGGCSKNSGNRGESGEVGGARLGGGRRDGQREERAGGVLCVRGWLTARLSIRGHLSHSV